MALHFKRVAIFGRAKAAHINGSFEQLCELVQSLGVDLVVEEQTAAAANLGSKWNRLPVQELVRFADLALVVGGDGTMLGVGRELAPFRVPLIGIHQGQLGFTTDIRMQELDRLLPEMLEGSFESDTRTLMQAVVIRQDQVVFEGLAMNDVVVHRGSTAGMLDLSLSVNDRFVARERGDGLIVASSTGATAYALSAGGPLVHPSMRCWILVTIAPHTLSHRPIVLSNESEISIELIKGDGCSVNFDMQSLSEFLPGDFVRVKRSDHQVHFLHPLGWSYFDTLRQKMHWNEEGTGRGT